MDRAVTGRAGDRGVHARRVARVQRAVPGSLFSLLVAACGADDGAESGAVRIELSPRSLTFDPLPPGAEHAEQVVVRNMGGARAVVDNAWVDSDPTAFRVELNGSGLPAGIDPGAELSLSIVYAPEAAPPAEGVLHVTSNAESGEAVIPITIIQRGSLLVAPNPVDFGTAAAGGESEQAISVRNIGRGPLLLDAVRLDGDAAFTLDGPGALPLTIESQATVEFAIRFLPDESGEFTATLALDSRIPETRRTEVPVRGTGR